MPSFAPARATARAAGRVRGLDRPEALLRVLAVAISVLFLARTAIRRHDLFYSNQNSYFPAGLRLSGHDFLDHDWFAQTRPPHLVFTYLAAALDRLGLLASGVAVLEVALEASLLVAIWLIVAGLYHGFTRDGSGLADNSSRPALTAITFSLLLLGMQHPPALRDRLVDLHGGDVAGLGETWARVFSLGGLAAQYLWGGYLQPSEFGILLLLAVGTMLFERWRLGALLAGLAVVMHFAYLPHAGLLMLVAAGWLYRSGQRRFALHTLIVFAVVVLPVVIYALTFAFEPESAAAHDILVHRRIPHHSVPAEWWSNTALGQLVLIAVAGLLLLWKRHGFLTWVMVVGFGYTALSIVLVALVVDNNALAFSHPWRGSVYLVPLSLFVIAAFIVAGTLHLLQRLSRRPWPLAWLAAAAGAMVLISTAGQALDAEPRSGSGPRAEEAAMVRRATEPDDVILIPDNWEAFRLEAERPVYVDFKSHPYLASEVLEWWRRLQTNRLFFVADESERATICAAEGVDYYVIPTDVAVVNHHQVAATEDYQLVACPAPS